MYNDKDTPVWFTHIVPISSSIVRVTHSKSEEIPPCGGFLSEAACAQKEKSISSFCERQPDGALAFYRNGSVLLRESSFSLKAQPLVQYVVDGTPKVQYRHTANGEVAYIENARAVPGGTAWTGTLAFTLTPEERLYGLGQQEDGIYNYNGKRQYLYQNNMKISIPFVVSSRNYAILLDTETAVVFDASAGQLTFALDTVECLSYYVLLGDGFEEIVGALRRLTGKAALLPRWAFGYIQSKEHYTSSAELLETAGRFRSEGIPLDCIVQDWATWPEGKWGDKHPDPLRYPDVSALVQQLHEEQVHFMVSIWPNMAPGGRDFEQFSEQRLLLPCAPIYNAFDPKARALYWEQCNEDWFSAGTDAFWCDNAEPFSDADWNGAQKRAEAQRYQVVVEDSKKSLDWRRLNTYGLMHAKGIYEHWRKSGSALRVVNLTRSTYLSGQRYGVIAWSGDLCATWETMRRQIVEGLQFSLCGFPYWTLDIGGFFTVKDKWENRGCGKAGDNTPLWFWNGDYNDGVNDLGYRELYVRWFEWGTFLPVFRAHGTDTPREPWQFGAKGTRFYEAIVSYLRLRYRLLPYLYSTAARAALHDEVMMRSLLFDFAQDENCADLCDCYLLGHALLVCPVTHPMYYGPNSTPLNRMPKTRQVYLPQGADWYDFWSGNFFCGGQTLEAPAPLEQMPVYVRAGSIVPFSAPLSYADERCGWVEELRVYEGADGRFTLYNDAGNNYSYEQGNYAEIDLHYCDSEKILTFSEVRGSFPFQTQFSVYLQRKSGGVTAPVSVCYDGHAVFVVLPTN